MTVAGIAPATAQTMDMDSFESFRKSIRGDFDSFRSTVLADYDKYLEGVWSEYNAFRGEVRDPVPKPSTAPVATEESPKPPVVLVPIPVEPPSPTLPPQKEPTPTLPPPDIKPTPALPLPPTAPVEPAEPIEPTAPEVSEVPTEPTEPEVPEEPTEPTVPGSSYNFYSIPVKVPLLDMGNIPASDDFASLWRVYSDHEVAEQILPVLQQYITAHNLNDWFVFELIRSYVAQLFADADANMRISLEHYLLNHFGYDVRLGIDSKKKPMLLIAFRQKVYARRFAEIDGQRYYIFYDAADESNTDNIDSFMTCNLPNDVQKGNSIDLVIYRELSIPYTPHEYRFHYKGLTIEGTVNANLMPMLYRYPQMPIDGYVQSMANRSIRDEVVGQLREQLTGMSQRQATDSLLQFVQSAFDYATDDEQHGFEKPYFFEEMLFYPQCDCEDRSVFYSYLLWHTLGVENHLIKYPGHEAVAAHLNPAINGDGYSYGGKNFYISDPTYIGAVTGMCMPNYRTEQPQIDSIVE